MSNDGDGDTGVLITLLAVMLIFTLALFTLSIKPECPLAHRATLINWQWACTTAPLTGK